MRKPIPLGGSAKDFNSRKSRETIFNGYIELDKDSKFHRIVRAPGFELEITVGDGPIRAMKEIRSNLYVVSGTEVFKITTELESTRIGIVEDDGLPAKIETNGADVGQILFLSAKKGHIFENDVFTDITDPAFDPDISVAILNERFWFNKPDSNFFFASEVADGSDYNSLDTAAAAESPDELRYVTPVQSNLLNMGSKTIEIWQTFQSEFPLRRVQGATIEKGVGAAFSVVKYENKVYWLGDDFRVYVTTGNGYQKISDLSFEVAVRGDGTLRFPGYESPEKARAFFVDSNIHKFYCLQFPEDDATWLYDLTTGLWHRRKSKDLGRWRISESERFIDNVYFGDFQNGNIYRQVNEYNEDGNDQEFILRTPATLSSRAGLFITSIELIMEVGLGTINSIQEGTGIKKTLPIPAKMLIMFSRDGGQTFPNQRSTSLGSVGDRQHRVKEYSYGYVKKDFEAVWEFRVNFDTPLNFFNLFIEYDEGASDG